MTMRMPALHEMEPHLIVLLIGHTDDKGAAWGLAGSGQGKAAPQCLSHERADSIPELLVAVRDAVVPHPAGGLVATMAHEGEIVWKTLHAQDF